MRYLLAFLVCSCGVAPAQQPATRPSDLDGTIDRGLAFLAKDALAWKEKYNCATCHHAALVVWSMREARQQGFRVNETVLSDLTRWLAESGDGKFSHSRPAGAPRAHNAKALYFALALATDPKPDAPSQEGYKRLLATVESDQLENGSWSAWPDTRPPLGTHSDESITLLSTLALMPAAAAGDVAAKAARDKGIRWLADTKTDDDPQSIALRLLVWERSSRPHEECEPLIRRIRERQNEDGGWSQAKEMASDAWATGQALYALSHAGIKASDAAIERGHRFLIKTQRGDGSWPMTSRSARPGDTGAHNLVPITGAGSAWAIIGLARSR
jgi:hypothetical protein